jgi:hypothetical protein
MRALSMLCSEFVVLLKRSSIILASLAAFCASGLRLNAQILTRGDLQKETAEYEAASRSAELPHIQSHHRVAIASRYRMNQPRGLVALATVSTAVRLTSSVERRLSQIRWRTRNQRPHASERL